MTVVKAVDFPPAEFPFFIYTVSNFCLDISPGNVATSIAIKLLENDDLLLITRLKFCLTCKLLFEISFEKPFYSESTSRSSATKALSHSLSIILSPLNKLKNH